MKLRLHAVIVALCLALLPVGTPSMAQATVPVLELASPTAISTNAFGSIFGVRQLTGERVLVNDGVRRQLLVVDSKLARPQIVIDSVSVGGQGYGPRAAPLIPYLADSSLFVDGVSLSLLVIDPHGNIAHVMSAPQPNDLRFLAASASGIDARGNLIYRGALPRGGQRPEAATAGAPAQQAALPPPDSAPILRANFDTRKVDTIAKVKVPSAARPDMQQGVDGKATLVMTINPMITVDEWAVLSGGSIAIVRGHDYHIDLIQPDGKFTPTAKLPFDWKRLTDADKQALIDSARTAQEQQFAAAKAAGVDIGSASKADEVGGGGGGGGGDRDKGDGGNRGNGGSNSRDERPRTQNIATRIDFVPLKEISDYYPAIRTGAAKADLDNQLWVLPTTSAQSKNGELVYDVLTANGQLRYRVRLPLGRSIAGFGHNGVVYLMHKTADGWMLERSRMLVN